MIARILPVLVVVLAAGPSLAQDGDAAAAPWRGMEDPALRWIGGVAVLGMLGVVALFALARGRIRVEGGLSGRRIRRFGAFERVVHWMTAASFVVLALSGLHLTFGHDLLAPLLGAQGFARLDEAARWAHLYLGFPFLLGALWMALLWARDSMPDGKDLAWLSAGGALVGRRRPAAGRFQPGQKMIVWITVLGGLVAAASAATLVVPTLGELAPAASLRSLHAATGLVMLGALIGHAYLRSIGIEGAFAAMGSGEVDLAWAKQHHGAWVEEELRKARATVAGPPAPKPAGAD
jgi:formate dehydrogenase subunit gamma